jgi:hypothetical protein
MHPDRTRSHDSAGLKRCSACGEEKQAAAFYASRGRLSSYCKDCQRQASRLAYRRHHQDPAVHAADRTDWAGAGRAAAGRGRGRPRRRPGGHRHLGPPRPSSRPGRSRAAGGGRGPLAQAPPAPSRLAGRPTLDRGPPAAAAPVQGPGGAGRTGAPAMTEQISQAQRRRTTRSTTITTATSAAIQTSTQIHSGPGMAHSFPAALLPGGMVSQRPSGGCGRGTTSTRLRRCRAGTPTASGGPVGPGRAWPGATGRPGRARSRA